MIDEMNTLEQKYNMPRWLRLSLAVTSTIITFRLAQFAIGLVFLQMGRFPMLLMVNNFLHNWGFIIVPSLAIATAVLVSRWQELILGKRSRKTCTIVLFVMTLLAFSPVRLAFYAQPVMVSPLTIAIQDNYPLKTISLIVNRYPHLVNDEDPLTWAAYQGRTNLVELLIKKGANVDKAVASLQQLGALEPLDLVLKLSENHNK